MVRRALQHLWGIRRGGEKERKKGRQGAKGKEGQSRGKGGERGGKGGDTHHLYLIRTTLRTHAHALVHTRVCTPLLLPKWKTNFTLGTTSSYTNTIT